MTSIMFKDKIISYKLPLEYLGESKNNSKEIPSFRISSVRKFENLTLIYFYLRESGVVDFTKHDFLLLKKGYPYTKLKIFLVKYHYRSNLSLVRFYPSRLKCVIKAVAMIQNSQVQVLVQNFAYTNFADSLDNLEFNSYWNSKSLDEAYDYFVWMKLYESFDYIHSTNFGFKLSTNTVKYCLSRMVHVRKYDREMDKRISTLRYDHETKDKLILALIRKNC